MKPLQCRKCNKDMAPDELAVRLKQYVARPWGGSSPVMHTFCDACAPWDDLAKAFPATVRPDHFEPCKGCGRPLYDARVALREAARKARLHVWEYPIPNRFVCSDTCAQRARRNKKVFFKIKCQYCRNEFTPAKSDARYCSSGCRAADHQYTKTAQR